MEYGWFSISVIFFKFVCVLGFEGLFFGLGMNFINISQEGKGYKRFSMMGEISGKFFGCSGLLFGGRNCKWQQEQQEKNKRYLFVSMNNVFVGVEEFRVFMDLK